MDTRTLQPVQTSSEAVDATRVLLRNLIDYAGLFPPASLGMAAAAANYDAYLRSEHSWMLGRFILPVARLGEFEETVGRLPGTKLQEDSHWGLSVLPGGDVSADLCRIREFNDRFESSHSTTRAKIESIEVKIANAGEIDRLSGLIPAELETYFEIPLTGGVGDSIVAVTGCGRRAKIRTGGETADKFPAPESVVEFIRLCAASNVAFKATAGLHHPVRSLHRLTYQADSPSGIMHGFLNVFLGAAFLRAGMVARLMLGLVNEQSAEAFRFDAGGVLWREHRLGIGDISAARREFAISFGSCSFTEPVEDLRALHVL
jgi:hypothetical protein